MKGGQVGGTEAGTNWIGFSIDLDPALMLIVYPVLSLVKRNTRSRIDPLIDSTPELRGKVAEAKSREAGNSVFRKEFPGGELIMTGANSAAGLRHTAARKLFLDEVDAYEEEADEEGDPVDLAIRRTVTFRGRKKIYMVSTPTKEGESRIHAAYLESNAAKFYVPCKGCGTFEVITWDQITWEKGLPDTAAYKCIHCGHLHPEHEKRYLLENGEWRTTAEGDGKTWGFHLPGFLSPFESWAEQARAFLKVKDDPNRMKVWVNNVKGEPSKAVGEEPPPWQHLYNRREVYPIGVVPAGGLFLTAGADVQADRIEVEIVAWGRNKESWSVDYRVLMGRTDTITSPVWIELTSLVNQEYMTANGESMPLRVLMIDEGYNTQTVRDWTRQHPSDRVLPCKGVENAAAAVGIPRAADVNSQGKRITRGVRVWPIGDSILKSQIYGWLKLERPTDTELKMGNKHPEGYCHFPQYDELFFQMLTAEQLVRVKKRGYVRLEWTKLDGRRNEALDCRKYARAAAYVAGLDRPGRIPWDELEGIYGATRPGEVLPLASADDEDTALAPGPAQPITPDPIPTKRSNPRPMPQRRSRRSGYMR